MYCSGEPIGFVYIAQNTSDWSQSTLTWNTKPATNYNVNAGKYNCPATSRYVSMDAKSVIEEMIAGREPNYGFQVHGSGSPNSGIWTRTFSSTRSANPPKLLVTYDYTAPQIPNNTATNPTNSTTATTSSDTPTSNSPSSSTKTSKPLSTNTTTSIAPPTGLQIDEKNNLSWVASSTADIDGYHIYSSIDDAEFGLLAEVAKTELTYSLGEFGAGNSIKYLIRSYKGDQESENSEIVTRVNLINNLNSEVKEQSSKAIT